MKKALLIVNPSSGGEKAKEYETLAYDKLASYFDDVDVKHTEKGGDAKQFAHEAAQQQLDSVFVMGGDGTVNEGISGLAEQDYRPKFGFFPLGTVNDLARALGMSLDPEEAINQISFETTSPLDIGKVNDAYFMNVVAIGTLPEAINDVAPEEKTTFGKMAYFMSGFKQLIKNKSYTFRLDIDGKTKEINSTTLLIGLTNSIGGFERILPEARVDDGLLHLIYLKDSNLLETVKALPSLLKGVEASDQTLGYQTFKEATIAMKEGQLSINVDGDEGEALPITVKVLPQHLQVYR
ncbi:diacylglycerol kinase family lipid kinase [Streptococcus equi subsp. zooepidemicus]|uniref:diacylglycerol/lipid kinase family protein n=1 Tax=Streptococcus equi TaxID=1336 RepID=UPI0024A8A803|nr:diacylglycerol kinase family protein [Streptococcus equi]MDI6043999.1 diacylglycerol kinase family lipid kinase [Streptococcus equi subsp. zooepidemicus]HEL0024926.1 diacylglycerol kinase family lipid kinase [Streptococcus equi subsp. zooepidemicus]HEL1117564.1 diacylglycerol kinase family lipid kinase [Streptococcus equi subsp. zooepidemicus]HEL1170946.1 diacylglycerol kinase family lipid kinase [Streptococcus equi subsp. zooepidemicus]HEL1222795.1 diacylglycerol kinase family lipid kinase